MKRSRALLFCLFAAAVAMVFGRIPSAQAFPQFFKVFEEIYVGDKSNDAQKSLATHIERVKKCNVCHDPRKDEDGKVSKKKRNPYGEALAKLLTKDDKKDTKKITTSLTSVAKEKAAESAKKIYGELLKEGKLPFEYPASELGE
jgi:predicted adenine nucleotide alpha hydrolase (AANH) superfamily ATPase